MFETPSFRIPTLATSIHGVLRNGRRSFIRGPRVIVMVGTVQQRVLACMAPQQRCVASIFGSILIRALNEKLNVQFIMAGRAADECTEIL